MPKFKFKAKKLTGEEIDDVREAADQFELAKKLREENFILTDIEEEGRKKGIGFKMPNWLSHVSAAEKVIFTRNLSVMVAAGLPISRALGVLIKQTANKKLKKIFSQISSDISKGDPLSEGMAKHPKIFSQLYVAMVKAGEKSGKMEESLKLVAEQLNRDSILIRKIKGAMVYPTVVIIAMIAIAILMFIYVVPTLTSVFKEIDMELPASTKLIIWISDSLITNSILVILAFLALVAVSVVAFRNPKIKTLVAAILLRVPVFSSLIKKINSARTTRTLATLISSGVNITDALNITADVVQNEHFKKVLREAGKEIQKGSSISSAFKKDGHIYPPLVGEMIAVGEETGELASLLLTLAVFYEEEVSEATKDMTTIIEPVLMIVIGIVVGFFAIAMMKPMYSMIGGF